MKKSCLAWTVVVVILSIAIIYQYSLNLYSASLDDVELANTYTIITGSSSGIGEAMAYQFCKNKANVIIAGTNTNKLQNVKSKCKSLGAKSIEFISISLDSLSNCIHFVQKALIILKENSANIKLDYLILNHAIMQPHSLERNNKLYLQPNSTYTLDELNNILKQTEIKFQINTLSYINIATLFYDYLQQSNGRIVISSSIEGVMPLPYSVVFTSNKFALNGFFESWRKELSASKSSVSVTICIIGFIGTEESLMLKTKIDSRFPINLANVTTTARNIIGGGQKRLKTVYTPFRDTSVMIAMYHYASTLTDMLIQYLLFGNV